MIKLSIKERREKFQFFLVLFVVAVGLLSFCIFYSANSRYEISKQELEGKIAENETFEKTVVMVNPIIDTVYKQISRFDPNVQAVFLNTDINDKLNSVKAAYQRKAADERYKIFIQSAQLYNILFYDRKEQKGNIGDIDRLQKSLDDCVMSRRQLQQTLSAQ